MISIKNVLRLGRLFTFAQALPNSYSLLQTPNYSFAFMQLF